MQGQFNAKKILPVRSQDNLVIHDTLILVPKTPLEEGNQNLFARSVVLFFTLKKLFNGYWVWGFGGNPVTPSLHLWNFVFVEKFADTSMDPTKMFLTPFLPSLTFCQPLNWVCDLYFISMPFILPIDVKTKPD